MAHHGHRHIQRFGELVQHPHGVVERARARLPGQCGQPRARLAQQLGRGCLHVFGADAVERNSKVDPEKWIGLRHNLHYFQPNRLSGPVPARDDKNYKMVTIEEDGL